MPTDQHPPDAQLLIATGCAHCPIVLAGLAELVKKGRIGRLDVVNIVQRPDIAEQLGVRGVPWIRIGPFELTGAYRQSELDAWAGRAGSAEGRRQYLSETLEGGGLDSVIAACRRSPELLPDLVTLGGDLDTPFAVRIGVGAVIEELAGDPALHGAEPAILALADSPHASVRADAAHFLGLLGTHTAQVRLALLLDDSDPEVREIAGESLAALPAAPDD